MSDNTNKDEQQFSIQPHPAKDNGELSDASQKEGGALAIELALILGSLGLLGDKTNPTSGQPGPHIMSNETANNLEEPLSRDELRKRADELNKE